MSQRFLAFISGVLCLSAPNNVLLAAPYASRISIGLPNALVAAEEGAPIVSFTLNEPADKLGYRINGGPMQWLDGSTSGVKSFPLLSALDEFTILAKKSEPVGYTIPTGDVTLPSTTGLSQPVPTAGLKLVSDDANRWMMFNAPRGVGVNMNPNSPHFGVAYVANGLDGVTSNGERLLNRGVYAVAADGTDAFGYGDFAFDPNMLFFGGQGAPMRVEVGADGEVYVADSSPISHGIVRLEGQLWFGVPVLPPGFGFLPLPPDANHGRVGGITVEGSPYDGTLVIHTIDRDLTSSQFGGSDVNDRNSVWRYDLGFDPQWSTFFPTKVSDDTFFPAQLAAPDLARGADGKFYLSSSTTGGSAGLVVLDPQGATIYDSQTASRDLFNDQTIADVLRQLMGIAISPDQQWLAAMLRNGNVAVVPLENGLPDLSGVMVVDTAMGNVPGRDVAFDAAGNLHCIVGGQSSYRVIAPGGTSYATTSWNGQSFSFGVSSVPEPSTLGLAIAVAIAAIGSARRASLTF
jgi:hypothetical protein